MAIARYLQNLSDASDACERALTNNGKASADAAMKKSILLFIFAMGLIALYAYGNVGLFKTMVNHTCPKNVAIGSIIFGNLILGLPLLVTIEGSLLLGSIKAMKYAFGKAKLELTYVQPTVRSAPEGEL